MGKLTLAVATLVVALATSASAATSLIQNGRFTDSAGGLPTGWRIEAWARDLSEFSSEPAADGGGMARIINRGSNDARLCQTIPVLPGASYRVSARVKTQDVGTATAGALIAIEPRIADSVDLKGTQDWQTLEVTTETQERTAWDVCLRLGSYANLNTGTAWFTDVRVELISGGTPPAAGSWWPRLTFGPALAALRQASWIETALPLVGGLLLAMGLGIVGRRSR